MQKKSLLGTLVLLSFMQCNTCSAELGFNDFFNVGRVGSNKQYFTVDSKGNIIKSSLAGENDKVSNDGNRVIIDMYSKVEKDQTTNKGTVFVLDGSYKYQGKEIVVNFHNDATFDGGTEQPTGHSSLKVGGFNKSDKVTINMDKDKTLSIVGRTVTHNNYQNFHVDCGSALSINNGNLVVKNLYPNKSSDWAAGIFVGNNSFLNIDNQSIKIVREFNRDNNIWEGWTDSGLYLSESKANITTKDLYIGKANEHVEAFEYGLSAYSGSECYINAETINIISGVNGVYGADKVNIEAEAQTININGGKYGIRGFDNSNFKTTAQNISISGGNYGVYLNNGTNFTSSADTTYLAADNGWSICLFGNSVADVTSVNNIVSGDIYAKDSKVLLKGNNNQLEGQVRMLEGSTIDFASKEDTNHGLTAIYSNGYSAVIGEAADGKVSTVNFKQSAVINAYEKVNGEYVTEYTNTPDKSAGRAIFAKRNSVINMSDAANSYAIYGDVVAGRGYDDSSVGGKVNIGGTGTVICGDVLAANTGTINVDINKGFIEGRIDSYEDMDTVEHSSRPGQIDEVPLKEAGNIKVSLNNSTWKARYQSWVSDLNLKDSVVDLTSDEGSSITMKKLSGNGTFNMKLNSEDHSKGNMLYIGDGSGKHTVNIVGGITGGYENISKENPLRFATVKNSGGEFVVADTEFGAITKGAGIYDLVYSVEKIDYDKNDADNEEYNGNGHKPKDEFVDNVLDADNTAENWVITGVQEKITSNAGEAVIDMSRSNYKNAVYLDRLNKRLGEARFIDGDEGMWVRMRHDRIGMKDAFRSSNTMYQLGYDKLHKEYENGERHIGAAIDYLDGETSYSKVGGTGETSRLGFWMYDTWLGNKGHYADYVAKFGHMSNDFDIKSLVTGESITGEYDNNLFSVSAEFGRKKDIGNDWYVEPQVQLQLARITDAAYATTQGTNVYVDAINSLIARAGFRLGKDVEKDSTIYFKADVMHEFLGDQRIVAGDNTGNMDKTFGNKGTWYDIGFGFSKVVGHNSYAYIDVEKSFGNDNDDTYQINGGVQWSF